MAIDIGLDATQRRGVTDVLHALLADEYVLYTKTRSYHWNVTGPHFNDYHKFFEALYTKLEQIVDDVAERARAVGGAAVGTLAEFTRLTRLGEHPGTYPGAAEMVQNLLADHEAIVRQLRQDIVTTQDRHGDLGTADFLTGLMEEHEKIAWMLRATLGE